MRHAFLCLACLFASSLCQAGESAGGTLIYSHFANVGPLNPHMYSPNQMFGQEAVYEPLVKLSTDGTIKPCLATSWDVSADGLEWTFRLREGVSFSDGAPFDADAVAKNFDHIMANRRRHAWVDLSNRIESYEAVSPYIFRLRLNSPYYPVLEDLSLPRPFRFLSPAAMPDSGITRDGIKKPVGTGAMKLRESRLGVHDIFERNEEYWGEPAKLAEVKVLVIPDPMSRAMAFQTGEIDLLYGQGQVDFDTFASLRANPQFVTGVSKPMGGVAAAINSNSGPTRELAVRKAIQHMADKDILVKGIFLATQPKADFLFSPDVPYCDVGLTPYVYDPSKANELLEQAGWRLTQGDPVRRRDGKRLEIDFCFVGNDATHKAIAEVLQGQAAKVGIRLNLVAEEEDSFLRRQKDGSFGMIINTTWGPPFEPHAMLSSMRQPSHADYQAQLGLPMKAELDADITRVVELVDVGERRDLYRRILTTLHEQAVYLPLHYNVLVAAYRKGRVDGFEFGAGKSDIPFEKFSVME